MNRITDIDEQLEELGLRVAALETQMRNLQREKFTLEREALEQKKLKKLSKLSYNAQLALFNMRKGWWIGAYGRYEGKGSPYEAVNKQTVANLREGGYIAYEEGPLEKPYFGRDTLLTDKGRTCPLPKFD